MYLGEGKGNKFGLLIKKLLTKGAFASQGKTGGGDISGVVCIQTLLEIKLKNLSQLIGRKFYQGPHWGCYYFMGRKIVFYFDLKAFFVGFNCRGGLPQKTSFRLCWTEGVKWFFYATPKTNRGPRVFFQAFYSGFLAFLNCGRRLFFLSFAERKKKRVVLRFSQKALSLFKLFSRNAYKGEKFKFIQICQKKISNLWIKKIQRGTFNGPKLRTVWANLF